MEVYKRLRKAQEVAKGSPVVQCGEFYIVGMKPFSECKIIDQDGYVRGNVIMKKLEKLGNANQLMVPNIQENKIYNSDNFDSAGFWIEKDLDEDGGLK